ncbi:hypothetical protein [Desulfovibrio falkowii]|uniref:hypothetical protein n=1 Tax=Desulfovibrio sp. WGS1351 TaxID=3366814 RepID=UPI00372D7C3C
MIDNKTPHLGLPLPDLGNLQDEDVPRIAEALEKLDGHAAETDVKLTGAAEDLGRTAVRVEALEGENQALAGEIAGVAAKLPSLARSDKAGIVKIGEGIDVEDDGTISVPPPPKISLATTASAGTVIIGEGLEIAGASSGEDAQAQPNPGTVSLGAHASEDGEKYGRGNFQFFGHVRLTDDFEETASASEGIGLSPAGAKAMYDKLLGLKGTTTMTSSRDFVAPEAATYRVTVVGGGGSGGSGGTAYDWSEYVNDAYWSYTAYSGGGGGGGGAGETLVRDVTLAKGESVPVIVGGPGGNSSFGSHAVARGGGRGGNGGSGSRGSGIPNGGGGGTSYGSGAGSGGRGSWDNNETPSITGGSGGAGGRSTHGQYGHGGNGGPGGGYSNGRRTSPSGGVSGTQGVVIVTLNLGG